MGNNKSKQESSQPEDSGYKYHITVLADVLESAETDLPLQKRNKHKNENQTEICDNSSLRDEDKNSSGMKVDQEKEKKVQMPYSKSFVTDRNPQNSSLGAEYKNSCATASYVEKRRKLHMQESKSFATVSSAQQTSSSRMSYNTDYRTVKHSATNLSPHLPSATVSSAQQTSSSRMSHNTDYRTVKHSATNLSPHLPSATVSSALKNPPPSKQNSDSSNQLIVKWPEKVKNDEKYTSDTRTSNTNTKCRGTAADVEKKKNLQIQDSKLLVSDKKPMKRKMTEIVKDMSPDKPLPKRKSDNKLIVNWPKKAKNTEKSNCDSHKTSTHSSSDGKSVELSRSTLVKDDEKNKMNPIVHTRQIQIPEMIRKNTSSNSSTDAVPALVTNTKQTGKPMAPPKKITDPSDSKCQLAILGSNEKKKHTWDTESTVQHKLEFTIEKQLASNLPLRLSSTSVSETQKNPSSSSLSDNIESRIEKHSTTNLPPNLSSIAVSDTQKKPPPSSLSETTELRIKQSLAPNQTSPFSTSVSDSLKKSSLTTLNENKGCRTGNPSVLNLSSHLYSTSVSSSQKSTTLSLMNSTESRIEKPSTTNLPPNLSSIAVSDTQKKPPPSSLSETTELRIKQSLAPNQTSPLSTSVSDSLKKSSLTTLNENKGSRTGNPSVLNLSSHLYSTSVSSSQKSTTLSLMDSTESRIEKPSTTNLPPNLSSIAVSDTQKSSSLSKNPESVSNDTVDYSSDKLALSHHDQTADHSANLCLNLIRQHVDGDGIYSNVDIGHSRDATKEDEFDIVYANDYCGRISCKFSGECVTHFHCSLPNCNFVTTTSSAMKQHRNNHHQFDDWIENGFRMFLKYESCCFSGCLESNKAKHVHCMRQGCKRIFHAPKQLLRHKQQHEQEDIQYAMNVGSMSLVAATSDGNVDSKTGSVFSVKQDMKHQLQNMSSGIVTTKKKISIVSSMLDQSSILSRQPKRKHPPETTVDTVPKVPKYADSPMIQPGTKNKFLTTAQNSNLVQIGKTEHIHRKISEESPLLKTCVKVPEDTQFKPKSASNKLSHNLSETDSVTYGAHSEFSEACSRLTPEFTVTVKIEQNRSFHEDKDDKFGAIDKNTLKNKSEISRSQQFDVVKKKSLTGKKLEKYNLNYDRLQSTSTSLKKNEKTEQYCKMDHIGSQSKKTNDLPVLATAPVFPLRKPKDQNNKNEKQKYSVMMKQLANAADCDSQFKPVPTQISTDMKLVKKEENIVLASSSGSVIPSSITQLVPTQIPTDVKLVKKEANTVFASSSDSVIPSSITQLVPAAMAKPYVKQDQSSHCVEPKWMKLLELVKGPDSLPQPTWKNMKTRMTFNTGSDCIPNCCLKSQKHYHCLECKTSFTLAKRLRYHINEHGLQLK